MATSKAANAPRKTTRAPVAGKTARSASTAPRKSTPAPAQTPPAAASARSDAAAKGAAAAPKADKPRKPKLVRDSFTIPKAEYLVLETLKQRAAKAGVPAKKSELLRAGIKALAALHDGALVAALGAVPTIKTGRPAKA